MKVGLLQEGDIIGDIPVSQRYHEIIEEVKLADKLGFSCFGTSEQHFSPPRFTVSAPEVLYSAIAAQTEQIKLRVMASVLLKWNHPILVSERISTLDIVSNGRAELCTARSNNKHTLEAFGVSSKETKAQWREGLEVVSKALHDEVLEHNGDIWKIPPRTIVPKPMQKSLPLSVAASGVSSHLEAGEKGIGVISFENYFGWDYLEECIEAYQQGLKNAKPVGPAVNNYHGLYVATAYCAETRQQAIDDAKETLLGYFKFILDLYRPLSKDPSYEYMSKINDLIEHEDDVEYLIEHSPSIVVGDPDTIIERLKRVEDMGIDEVVLRVDGFGHEKNMKAIELIGKHVIPHVSGSVSTISS